MQKTLSSYDLIRSTKINEAHKSNKRVAFCDTEKTNQGRYLENILNIDTLNNQDKNI